MNPAGIVILGGPFPSTVILYNHLKSNFNVRRVIIEKRESRFTVLRKRARRLGIGKALGQLAFRIAAIPLLEATSRRRIREIARDAALDVTPVSEEMLTNVESANSEETIAILKQLNPAMVLVNGTRILTQQVLDSIPGKFVNLHAGITPRYRGVHGAYWALVENRRDLCGVTLHEVDSGIDTGAVIAQAAIQPDAKDDFVTYPWLQLAAALPLLDQVMPALMAGTTQAAHRHTGEDSRLWSHPTLAEYLSHRFRGGVR